MIAQLTGTVIQLGPTSAVVEVGGFGVLVLCGPNTTALLRVGEPATLSTSLVVREDSLTLYAFATVDERELFELLQTATGVGPKLAQAALAVLTPDELRSAIATENLVQLCKVPGVGRKGAQRLVIELKDKINLTRLVSEPATIETGRVDGDQRGRLAGPGQPGPAGPRLVHPGRRGGVRRGRVAGRRSRSRGAAADARRAADPGPPMRRARR